jgi:branched-chain amino acid transport system permease protein
VGALAIGFLSIRVGGVYFIMLTLAFSQMFFALTFQNAFLGAEDGITSVPRPHVFGLSIAALGAFHVYLLAIVGAAALSLHRIVRSPFGHVLRGIHDNEERMQAVGLPGRPLQAPRLRHRGDGGGRGRLALHAVRRLHLPRRVSLDHLG